MWQTNSLWMEVSIVTLFFLMGNIFLGHFEERAPKWRKMLKYIVTLIIVLVISFYFGRTIAMGLLFLALLPVIYIHGIVLPRNGINGWTAEPKKKYYEFRGWNTDDFKKDN